jgi:hypothetical protein
MSDRTKNHELVESLRTLEYGLARHFRGQKLRVCGRFMRVETIIKMLRDYLEQIDLVEDAYAMWVKESVAEDDAFRGDISPLLAHLRIFIAAMFGPSSPRMREFGFAPVGEEPYVSLRDREDEGEGEGEDQVADDDEDGDEDSDDERDADDITAELPPVEMSASHSSSQ